MASLNKVILIGNLTRDPELRYTQSGMAIAKFGLAVNERFKQGDDWKEKVNFIDIVVWGKQGENCSEYLSKGRQAGIEGRLSYSTWETEDGQKRSKLEVVAEKVIFLGSKSDGERGGERSGGSSYGGGSRGGDEPAGGGGPDYDDVPF
ncbi:MAG: single-stranded DNA-binding protein [Nitrospinae bacterium]|nr:single-stranded DNA-binding protein [Nitrospinota bacterium]